MKTLYFEGAGMPEADVSRATIGNCRVRTAFHLDNGKPVYLELTGNERSKRYTSSIYKWQYTGFVDACFYVTDDKPNNDANFHRLLRDGDEEAQRKADAFLKNRMDVDYMTAHRTPTKAQADHHLAELYVNAFVERNVHFEYSETGILNFLRSIGASFEAIKVDNDPQGYHVYKQIFKGGIDSYYYGDEYTPSEKER